MIWLTMQLWAFLMIAFAIGVGAGWWARGGRQEASRDASAIHRSLREADIVGDLKEAPRVKTGLEPDVVESGSLTTGLSAGHISGHVSSLGHDGDDLSLIDGVDANLANRLNALGVKRFDQIAAWSPANCAWIEDQIGDRGRIAREGWIEQARAYGDKGDL